ncbi:MAG TPA: response regulator transcription factor [Burkholderiales bacterium]|nr:response regulator transcription factor [Burkholderiales bacterium]
MIKVVIVDDHAILRRGLHQIIVESGDMEVVGEADTSAAALRLLREQPCNVLLLDVTLPDRNGVETLKLVRKEFPKLQVLMLSMHPENQYAVRALKAGAAGYLTKQSAPAQLVSAIRQVNQGRKYVTPAVAEELAQSLGQDIETPLHHALSNREFQTLCLIASGKTLTEIAGQMSLSVKTVSVYRARLLEKMRLRNNAELTHYAIKNQIVE